ncbi:MAG: hypothetical protein U5Q44_11680, partial [Dehalococcoidia bacterium]|nr:hypothetical protein [Dehalococcoidia bacterium]
MESRETIEGVPAGEGLAVAEIEGNGQCTVDSTATDYPTRALLTYGEEPSASDLASAPLVADGQVNYDVRKGETAYVAFANRGCG